MSLRETKDHIASVRSTRKITSALKLVSSAKLRKAQKTIETLRPYEQTLTSVFASLRASRPGEGAGLAALGAGGTAEGGAAVAVVVIASNSSMCGAFNSNVCRKALEVVRGCSGPARVHALGRKAADALRREGYGSEADYTQLSAHPSYEAVAEMSRRLSAGFLKGELSRVVLVYSHFVSASRQEVMVENYLPFEDAGSAAGASGDPEAFIVEPSAEQVLESMLPRVLALKLYAAVLDSAASEHAARMLAMQTATDNADALLSTLTLEYNKARQQKITNEILDLLGGAAK